MTESGRPYAVVASIAERLILENRALLDQVGGPARTVLANLRYGKYLVRVVIPLIMPEKSELDLPKVGVDVVPP